MEIKQLILQGFRNFKNKSVDFGSGVNVIVGPNAVGKTNILEGIYLLSSGKSFKARVEEEMLGYDSQITKIVGNVESGTENDQSEIKLEVILTRGEIRIGDDSEKLQKTPRKRLLVNGLSKRLIDFAARFRVSIFGPWDLELVTESPSIRRKFLDYVLSQTDREYRRAALSYEKGLRQRNKLLFRIREEGLSRSLLLFWDKLLIKNGDYISEKRRNFIDFVNMQGDFLDQDFSVVYDGSSISEARIAQYETEEVAAATTLVGPHRDDFIFEIKTSRTTTKRDLAKYGSRGEQRMGVLWLKLAELDYVEKVVGERPVLLLDDIFSELDHTHRNIVADLSLKQQTIITTADPHYVEGLEHIEKIVLNE